MKAWATVVSWQQGMARLRYQARAKCGSCHSCSGCGGPPVNRLGVTREHEFDVFIEQPLAPGQSVEIAIAEGSLLRSALLVYLVPLSGLIFGSMLFQWLFFNDHLTVIGAFTGGTVGFFLARAMAKKFDNHVNYQYFLFKTDLPPEVISRRGEAGYGNKTAG